MAKEVGFLPGTVGSVHMLKLSLAVRKQPGKIQGLPVRATWFDIDDYVATSQDDWSGARVVSGSMYPSTAKAEFWVIKGAAATVGVDPTDRDLIDCSHRWLPEDAGKVPDANGDQEWLSVSDDTPLPIRGQWTVLEESSYSVWNNDVGRFIDLAAVQFKDEQFGVTDAFSFVERADGPGCMGVFVVPLSMRNHPLMTWVNPDGQSIIVTVDRNGFLSVQNRYGTPHNQALFPPAAYNKPFIVGLRYNTETQEYEVFFKTTAATSPTVLTFPSTQFPVNIQCSFMTGTFDQTVEMLDFALWDEGVTDEQWSKAIAGYTTGYGVRT